MTRKAERKVGLTRRDFIKVTGTSTFILSLNTLNFKNAAAAEGSYYPYKSWEDLYRNQWKWDRIVKVTHGFANCASACALDVYVKDGMVWREEQTTHYPPTNSYLPDFNPRGCQKGICYSENMYSPGRIKYPLKRLGERGEGKWRRVSWDEALTEIADKVIDVIKEHGPDAIVTTIGTMLDFGVQGVARFRLMGVLGGTIIDEWGTTGDMDAGAVITWGHAHADGTSDDWFNSDYIILWTVNPSYTRIPDAHFIWEAKYNGAQIISIAPDYNASSIHADLWVNPKIGTDIALALGMANVIVNEGLYDTGYIKEQTDFPFLVREDNRRFLRESDIEKRGREDIFYFRDLSTGQIKKAPGCKGHEERTLKLGDMNPALEGSWEVKLADGRAIKVRPVFERLKEVLKDYSPEKVSRITNISGKLIEKIARDYARARSALIICGWGVNKFYHNDLMERSRILLAALTGNIGKQGGGFRTLSVYAMEGFYDLSSMWVSVKQSKTKTCPGSIWMYAHGGLKEASSKYVDKDMNRPLDEYIMESIKKGWMPIFPKLDRNPKIMIECGGNTLRRVKANHLLRKHLWPKLDLIVDINYRMDSTALNSDIVLPAAGYYEKLSLKGAYAYIPFLHLSNKAVDSIHEAKDELEIHLLLAKKIQERARQKGFTKYRDEFFGITRDLGNFYHTFTDGGKFENHELVLNYILENSACSKGIKLEDLKREGFMKYTSAGPRFGPFRKTSEFKEGQALAPYQIYTIDKEPWETLTGRQQFYIDHDWFLEFGEELPVHKDSPPLGGNYPLKLTGGHTRWSIHSMWRDDKYMLRLQRGVPVMYMNPEDARTRRIKDHDYVRVYNDVEGFRIHAKVSPTVREGQVIIYHAWENYQFDSQKGFNILMPTPLKPLQLVGNYGQLYYDIPYYQPNAVDRDTMVEVEKM